MTRLTCAFGSCDGAPRFKVVPVLISPAPGPYPGTTLGFDRIAKVKDHQYTCGRHLAQVTGALLTDHDQVIVSRLGVPLLGTLRAPEAVTEPSGEGTGVGHARAA